MTRYASLIWAVILVVPSLAALPSLAAGDDAKQAPRKLTSQDLADWIDQRFAKEYERAGISAAETVDDATFLRRVYLDLQGRVPTVAQLRDFLADEGSFKRQDY